MVSVVTTLVFTPSLFSSAEHAKKGTDTFFASSPYSSSFSCTCTGFLVLVRHEKKGRTPRNLLGVRNNLPPPSEKGEERLCDLYYVKTSTGYLDTISQPIGFTACKTRRAIVAAFHEIGHLIPYVRKSPQSAGKN